MDRVLLAAGLVAVAVVAARLLERRRPAPPTQSHSQVPAQLDRADFTGPDRPWLVVVFTSSACERCREATAKAEVLASPQVAYQEVSYQEHGGLHRRYAVEAVPLVVMADADGVVRASFVGVPTATDLWAALADARRPPDDG